MHHLAVINVQNCKQIWQSWAIPEKIQTGGGGDEYILFWKPPTKFLDLSLYPMKFQRKQASTPGNSAKFCDTPWKFQSQKPRSMEITWLFLVHSWKFHFFFNWPIEFTRFSIPLEIPCPQPPIWIFPGIGRVLAKNLPKSSLKWQFLLVQKKLKIRELQIQNQ